VFELADSLGGSDRVYLTFKDLDHNDFISQGIFKRLLASWPDDGRTPSRPAAVPGSPEASYETLCGYVLAFLDARLRGAPSRQEALDATYLHTPLGGELPHVERVPAGERAAPPYRDDTGMPPEPRQVRGLLRERGQEATAAILKAAHDKAPEAPVFEESVGFALIEELLASGRTPDAVAIYRLYGTFDPKFRRRLTEMGKAYLRYGRKRGALDHFEKAVRLDPDDAEAAEQVKALRREIQAP
jgi:tetratricopeptide (TPR) repeat protein